MAHQPTWRIHLSDSSRIAYNHPTSRAQSLVRDDHLSAELPSQRSHPAALRDPAADASGSWEGLKGVDDHGAMWVMGGCIHTYIYIDNIYIYKHILYIYIY